METSYITNIYFMNGGEVSGNAADPAQGDIPTPNPKNPAENKSGGFKQMATFAVGQQIGKTVINYAASRVQMYSGSSDMQDKANGISSLITTGVAIAINPAMGIAMAALNLATKALDYAHKRKTEGIELNQARLRAGPSLNRSRMDG